jgi:hypothetical protein
MEIKFTDTVGVADIYYPKPASQFIPDWYKNVVSYLSGEKKPTGGGLGSTTIKKCMPVFDAITSGYIIVTPADVYVSQKEDEKGNKFPWYEWSSLDLISFHPIEQAPDHPAQNGFSYPKWRNAWAVKTPKGYSSMFVQPMHRESVFTILPGIVDTDEYFAPVHFPFVLNDPTFEGIIPAGTPVAQVIPFKRDTWKMKFGNQEDIIESNKISIKLTSKIFDRYKTMFRTPKEYK